MEYEACLLKDRARENSENESHSSNDDVLNTPDSSPVETQDELRRARIHHFSTRDVERPLRFRHSNGSPSLSLNNENPTTSPPFIYGDDEVDRFFDRLTYSTLKLGSMMDLLRTTVT